MGTHHQSNSSRLIKNTVFMYVRMLFLMIISLYTSRVILQQLGVDDYGIYNLIGSIVAMFVSLKTIFAGSTQRFLNYEIGCGHLENLQIVFNTGFIINLFIGIVFVGFAECVGLWFVEYKINVDVSRLVAVHWVLQFSILTTFITILCIPFEACIIAHERMDFYAYLSIFEGLAKLGICYMLSIWDTDKLILYGFLMMIISIGVLLTDIFFCRKYFGECYLTKNINREYIVRMSKFAGWAFLGNTSNAMSNNGLNMVLNIFGGPVVNAARGITQHVVGALNQLTGNITIVVKPFVVKTYAGGDVKKAINFSFFSSKIYFMIQMILVIVITFLTERILTFWLGNVPEYTTIFLVLIMLQSQIRSLHMPIDMLFSGKGDIKYYQISEGIILFLPVPMSYLLLKLGLPYYTAILSLIVTELIHIFTITLICKKVCGLPLGQYYRNVILPCAMCFFAFGVFYWINTFIKDNILLTIANVCITMLFTIFLMIIVGFSKNERILLFSLINIKYGKNKRC